MLRDRILEWNRILRPFARTPVNLDRSVQTTLSMPGISKGKKADTDVQRVEFNLNVSRAYMKLNQLAK